MTEAITTPSPDICVECGDGLEQYSEEFGWHFGRPGEMTAMQKKVTIYQWFRVGDETGPLCRDCACQEKLVWEYSDIS